MSPIRAPSAIASESAKNGIPRFAFSEPSIGSITTWKPPPRSSSSPSSSETMESTSPVERKRSTTACSAASSIAVVSSPPSPSPTTRDRASGDGISASTRSTSSAAARQIASQSGVKRKEQQSRGQLREEVGGLLRHDLAAAGDLEDVLDPGRAQ